MDAGMRTVWSVFKPRIGFAIMLCALAGLAATPGASLPAWKVAVLAVAVFLSSASAGAFNQVVERELDRLMARTRKRPFATGAFTSVRGWYAAILGLLALSVGAAAWALNEFAALYTFLGAFFYGVVYTVWLKRRTWLNIVIGGLAGSFAVLAGAAAAGAELAREPLILALVLFLWTPPHFWALAMAFRDDYAAAGVPMLPVVAGDATASWAILAHAVALALLALVPGFLGLGWIYMLGAALGGALFVGRCLALVRAPGRAAALRAFHASLVQLTLLLGATILDGSLG